MSAPKRIQLRRTKGWRKPEGAIVVARPSRYGNPFKVERRWDGQFGWVTVATDGRLTTNERLSHAEALLDAVEMFALHGGAMGSHEIGQDDLERLRGHDLACWCPLDQPCHADVLLEWANR